MKILWKMEHLLQKNKCSISHNIFKYVIFQRRQKALLWTRSKGLMTRRNFLDYYLYTLANYITRYILDCNLLKFSQHHSSH